MLFVLHSCPAELCKMKWTRYAVQSVLQAVSVDFTTVKTLILETDTWRLTPIICVENRQLL